MGALGIKYEYGFMPNYMVEQNQIGITTLTGTLSMNQLLVPLKIEGNYTTYSIRPETENYFRIGLDKTALKNRLSKKQASFESTFNSKMNELQSKRQVLLSEISAKKYTRPSAPHVEHRPKVEFDSYKINECNIDSTARQTDILNSSSYYQGPADYSLDTSYTHSIERNVQIIESKQKKLAELDAEIASLQRYKELHSNYYSEFKRPMPFGSLEERLKHIQTLDFGQVTPLFSRFAINQISLKGILLEYSSTSSEFSFCHGRIIDQPIQTLDQRQNYVRTIFQDVVPASDRTSDRIVAGSLRVFNNETHTLHVAMLYGVDKMTVDSIPSDNTSSVSQSGKNMVCEVLGKSKILDNASLEYSFAKSFQWSQLMNEASNDQPWDTDKSGAGWVKLQTGIPNTKLKFSVGGTVVSSNYFSLANPFIRLGQRSIESQLKRKGDKSSLSIQVKHSDNALSKESSERSIVMQNVMLQMQTKILKWWSSVFFVSPVIMRSAEHNVEKAQVNEMIQMGSTQTVTHRHRDMFYLCSISANHSLAMISNQDIGSNFSTTDLSMMLTSNFKTKWSNSLLYKFTQTDGVDSSWAKRTQAIIGDMRYVLSKGLTTNVGASLILNEYEIPQVGVRLACSILVTNHFTILTSAERVALENYYSESVLSYYRQFPYRFSISVNYTLT